MKMSKYFAVAILSLGLLASCGESSESKSDNKKSKKNTEWTFNPSNTKVQWTAFKTTSRVGVKGAFEQFTVDYNKEYKSVEELLSSVKFSIPIASLNTGNPGRDQLIKAFFFGTMTNTDTIHGSFTMADHDVLTLKLKLNDMEHIQSANYTSRNDSVFVNCNLEMSHWNALNAVEALNEKCFDVHKGADGVSKTWSDVDVLISAKLK